MGRGARKCRSRAARYSVTLGQSPGALSPRRLSFRANPADSHRHGPSCSRLSGFFRLRSIVLWAGGSMPLTESQCSRPFRGMPGAPYGRGSQGYSVARTLIPLVSGERRHLGSAKVSVRFGVTGFAQPA